MSAKRHIIYCAIKKERLVYDTLYSILTFFQKNKNENIKIVIYTDKKNLFTIEMEKNNIFSLYDIAIEEVDSKTVDIWTKSGSMYEVKIHVILDFFDKYNDHALFFDSDMYFINSISSLFHYIDHKEFVMYMRAREIYAVFSEYQEEMKNEFYTSDDKVMVKDSKIFLPSNYYHYLSGVLGINRIYKDSIYEVLELYQELHKYTLLPNSEEIAYSCVFQNIHTINTATDIVETYTNFDYFRYIIAYTLNCFLNNDEQKLKNVFEHYNLKYSKLSMLNLKYDDVKIFGIILQRYIRKLNIEPIDILSTIMFLDNYHDIRLSHIRKKIIDLTDAFKKLV